MKTAVFAYSRRGIETARKILEILPEGELGLYVPERLSEADTEPIAKPSQPFYAELFQWADALIFVSSCGIAVREIAPHVRSKKSDPAVLCVDELGQYVIPLLSGHIGGANEITSLLAPALGAQAIITTATDINKRFSVDVWAVKNGIIIDSFQRTKEISAAILERDIAFSGMLPVVSNLPNGLYLSEQGPVGIFLGWEICEPYAKTLRLIPQILHLGIGCRKGTTTETIRMAVTEALKGANIDRRAINCAASIELKKDEPGLLEFCRAEALEIHFYTAEELSAAGEEQYAASEFVKKITGIDNVCERAAMIGADRLILRKTVSNGVTIAIAAEKKEVCFE